MINSLPAAHTADKRIRSSNLFEQSLFLP